MIKLVATLLECSPLHLIILFIENHMLLGTHQTPDSTHILFLYVWHDILYLLQQITESIEMSEVPFGLSCSY